jgi:hypothetical protein
MWFGRQKRALLWYYVSLGFAFDMMSVYQHRVDDNTRYMSNAYPLIEFLMVGWYFSLELFSGPFRRVIQGFIVAIGFLFVADTIGLMRNKTNWEGISIFNAISIILCIAALYRVMNNIEHVKIERSPLFIFSSSFLLFSSACLMLMLFADHFRRMAPEVGQQFWSIHNFFNIVKNLAIARVFYLQSKVKAG